jgi:membrane-bound metal-dependent hydrolase YbcI (DUF457 family)
MTGKGHLGTGFALIIATFTFTNEVGSIAVLATFFSLLGSTAPDWLEIRHSGGTVIPHRTITHWIPVWFMAFCFSLYSIDPLYFGFFDYLTFFDDYVLDINMASILLGFSIGGLLHLLFDLPNPMGVPFLTPWHRITLKLWASGEMEKPIIAFVFILSLIYTFKDLVIQ